MRKYITLLLTLLFTYPTQAQSIPPQNATLSNYQYPFPVQFLELHLQQQTLKMAYMDLQPQQPNGKTVLLLHGKNFCAAYWEQTAKDLSKHGFRVIMPDQIGFGKSDKPNHFQYTFQQLAQNTKAILDTLHITKVAVLGHSMGGMLATRFALMYPEMTAQLILENPIGLEDWKLKVPYLPIDQWYKGELQQNYAKIKQYQLDSYYDGKWNADFDKWASLQASWTQSPDYPVVAWNSALTYDMIFTQPVVYEFENVKASTLLIIGQRDRTALGKANVPEAVRKTMGNYPALGKLTAQKIKNAKLVPIEGVGHLPHIEAYTKFITPLLAFLQQ